MATSVKSRDLTAKGGASNAGAKTSSTVKAGAVSKSGTATTKSDDAAKPKITRPRGFFFGMMALFLGMEIIQIGLTYLDLHFTHKDPSTGKLVGLLDRPVLFQLPIVGPVTPMLVIFVGLAVLLYWALIRFKILPTSRQLAEQRMAATTAKTGSASPAKGALASKAKSGGVATAAKGTATKTTNGKADAKGTAVANGKTSTAGKATTATKTPSVVKGKTKVAEAEPATAGGDDDLYDQVKAQLRAQARKRRKH
jgi:hypothetical protein